MHEFDIWNGFMLKLVLLVYLCMIQYVPNKITRKSTHRCAILTCITWLTCITRITYITFIICLTCITCITGITSISCITCITWNTYITCITCITFIAELLVFVLLVYYLYLLYHLYYLIYLKKKKSYSPTYNFKSRDDSASKKFGFGKKYLQDVNVCSIQYLQHRNILCLWIMIEFERSVRGAKHRIKYKLIHMH